MKELRGCCMGLENLGIRIKQERTRQCITQEQLAEKADISLNFMSLIENGKNMSVQTLINIAKALNVSVDYLLSDAKDNYSDIITERIAEDISTLNPDEKLFFMNMIKQYKSLNR